MAAHINNSNYTNTFLWSVQINWTIKPLIQWWELQKDFQCPLLARQEGGISVNLQSVSILCPICKICFITYSVFIVVNKLFFAWLTFPQTILGSPQWVITSCIPIDTISWSTIVSAKHYYRVFVHSLGFKSIQNLTQDGGEMRHTKCEQEEIKCL